MTPLGWLGRKTSTQTKISMDCLETWYVHWYCGDLLWDCSWENFVNFWWRYLPRTHPYYRFRIVTWVSLSGFSPHLMCALILWRSGFGLLMGQFCQFMTVMPASVAQLDAPSDWRPGGRGFNPRRGRQHSFVEIDHEILSTVILSLPLIQEGQLSVSGERMCTILVNRLED